MPYIWENGIKYLGGTIETEVEEIIKLSDLVKDHIQRISIDTRESANRPQHRKTLVATIAKFRVCEDIPKELKVGFLGVEGEYKCFVRFSNASALMGKDSDNDLRGCAIRIHLGDNKFHDLLMTNAECHHAKDAVEAMWTSHLFYKTNIWNKATGFIKLATMFGPVTAVRILNTLSNQIKNPVESLATETYWSRSAYKFGNIAVRFRLSPEKTESNKVSKSCDDLNEELKQKIQLSEVVFKFEVQCYVDEEKTPIEDSTKSWSHGDAPFKQIGYLIINQKADLNQFELIDAIKFNPWNVSDSSIFEPLGNLNRARKQVYIASANSR